MCCDSRKLPSDGSGRRRENHAAQRMAKAAAIGSAGITGASGRVKRQTKAIGAAWRRFPHARGRRKGVGMPCLQHGWAGSGTVAGSGGAWCHAVVAHGAPGVQRQQGQEHGSPDDMQDFHGLRRRGCQCGRKPAWETGMQDMRMETPQKFPKPGAPALPSRQVYSTMICPTMPASM